MRAHTHTYEIKKKYRARRREKDEEGKTCIPLGDEACSGRALILYWPPSLTDGLMTSQRIVPALSSWPRQQRPLGLAALIPKAGLCPVSGGVIGSYQSPASAFCVKLSTPSTLSSPSGSEGCLRNRLLLGPFLALLNFFVCLYPSRPTYWNLTLLRNTVKGTILWVCPQVPTQGGILPAPGVCVPPHTTQQPQNASYTCLSKSWILGDRLVTCWICRCCFKEFGRIRCSKHPFTPLKYKRLLKFFQTINSSIVI